MRVSREVQYSRVQVGEMREALDKLDRKLDPDGSYNQCYGDYVYAAWLKQKFGMEVEEMRRLVARRGSL